MKFYLYIYEITLILNYIYTYKVKRYVDNNINDTYVLSNNSFREYNHSKILNNSNINETIISFYKNQSSFVTKERNKTHNDNRNSNNTIIYSFMGKYFVLSKSLPVKEDKQFLSFFGNDTFTFLLSNNELRIFSIKNKLLIDSIYISMLYNIKLSQNYETTSGIYEIGLCKEGYCFELNGSGFKWIICLNDKKQYIETVEQLKIERLKQQNKCMGNINEYDLSCFHIKKEKKENIKPKKKEIKIIKKIITEVLPPLIVPYYIIDNSCFDNRIKCKKRNYKF